MEGNVEVQICRVSLLTDMVNEELARYLKYHKEMEKWKETEPLDWKNEPDFVSKERLKRLMLVLREEMIKLDKIL